jgi:hypothetical protein
MISKDPYYSTKMVQQYSPEKWDGDAFQKNARLDEMYERVNALNPSLVIDAGCGRNKHKAHIKNLVGFDASPFPEVDYHCPILEAPFDINSADAVLCLGSIQFISREYIKENIDRVISWVKPGGLIEMRVMVWDSNANDYKKKHDPRSVKISWDDDLRSEITNKYNLDYFIETWSYQADLSSGAVTLVNRPTEKLNQKRHLKRECWTWRKNK